MGTPDTAQIDRLRERAHREVDAGLLPSCQWALALDGEVIAGETYGDATPEHRYVIFSATKAIVASTVWTLIQTGDLDVDLPVVELVPEFLAESEPDRRDLITVEQVLLHTSGFPHAPMGPSVWGERQTRLAQMARWRLNWEPGSQFEYHPTSAHWVLAEIIERLAGDDYRAVVRERVLDPHGLDRFQLGVPADQQGDITELVDVGEPPTPEELQALFGISELPLGEVTQDALVGFNDTDAKAVGVPGGGGVSDAETMARFYQALLHNPEGVWTDDALADFTGNVRNHFPDPMLGHPVERTLGLCTAGDDGKSAARGFGKTVSGRAFGHAGAGGQIAWADPESGLSFCYLTNGLDAHVLRQARRGVALSSIAGACVA